MKKHLQIPNTPNLDGKTLNEIAEAFQVTRERVRQIEVKALKKINDIIED
jgi:DNA-directed RNA polymerase sigma subunit (sigma70/sigma32)